MTSGGGTGLAVFLIPFRDVLLMQCRVLRLGGKKWKRMSWLCPCCVSSPSICWLVDGVKAQ